MLIVSEQALLKLDEFIFQQLFQLASFRRFGAFVQGFLKPPNIGCEDPAVHRYSPTQRKRLTPNLGVIAFT